MFPVFKAVVRGLPEQRHQIWSEDIRFGLKNNETLFPSDVSTLLPPKYIRSLITFSHEG